MTMCSHETILQWHPELILISNNPMTWKGYLIVNCQSDVGQNTRVKLKLVAAHYPSLKDVKIMFGYTQNALHSKEFSKKVHRLLKSATNVPSFLRQLQLLLENILTEKNILLPSLIEKQVKSIVLELKDAFRIPSEVLLSASNNLNKIKLSLGNISIALRKLNGIGETWEVVSSDLPEIPTFGPFEQNLTTLRAARYKFELQVGILQKSWKLLQELDENCCIIDPVQPKPYHLYRRIYLTDSLSMLVNINPLKLEDLPDIKFLGSETEIENQRSIISNNLHKWNDDSSILNNLLMILDIQEFPQRIKVKAVDINDVIIADEECSICFSLELDSASYPDKVCCNTKCRKHFHATCLLMWLRAVPGNEIVFNCIHGKCPNCEENIFCHLN